MLRRALVALTALTSTAVPLLAQTRESADTSRDNLMVVLRETTGANKQDETLTPTGRAKVELPDGKEIEFDTGWFEYIGDMHIRFVFDGPTSMQGATPTDLARLNLTPDQALQVAVANIKRIYGKPIASPWNGLLDVQGRSPDLNSSYFLDREFWQGQLKLHPEGLVVCVAKRGGLLFTPLSNVEGVALLRRSVGYLYSSSERLRVSAALYLFKGGNWSVFQAPVTQ